MVTDPERGTPVRCGLSLPVVQQLPGRAQEWEARAGAAELTTVAAAAERLGFSHISACDHIAIPSSCTASAGAVWYDAAVTLAFLAGVTSRVRLLSHVMVLPYRHPLVVAKAFATLDHLSNGRVILGIGCGHLKPEFRLLGVPYEQRASLTDEYVGAIAAAWENAYASFQGSTVQFRDLCVAPRPQQRPRPPIWVGGNSRSAVRRAALRAEGWIPWMITPAGFAVLARHAREVRSRRADACKLELIAPLSIDIHDGAERIQASMREWTSAGATAFHVGFAHHSLAHLLERMAMFAEAVPLQPGPAPTVPLRL